MAHGARLSAQMACLATLGRSGTPENGSRAGVATGGSPYCTTSTTRAMSIRFESLSPVVCLVVATQLATAAGVTSARPGLRPSDCKARDADSTCATAVAGVTIGSPPQVQPAAPLYDGPLGGVPAHGYAYWGFDFIADQTGTTSPVRPDEFINRSKVPVTITLTFNFPSDHPCKKDCLPGVEFEVDAGWFKIDPPYVTLGNRVSVTQVFEPGRGYGWMIGLWQSTNPRLTVTVPKGAKTTLQEVGLPSLPAIADVISAVTGTCSCWDGSEAACSDGNHFSNGLLGPWYQNLDNYIRAGSFNNCPSER